MKRKGLILLMAVGLLQACSDKNKMPSDVLPQPKMQAVMWDLMRGADFLNNYVFFKGEPVDQTVESEKWNKKIFQMHKITKQQFDKSYAYYQQHPMLMKTMMDSIARIKVEQPVKPSGADSTAKSDSAAKKLRMDTSGFRNKLNHIRRLTGRRREKAL